MGAPGAARRTVSVCPVCVRTLPARVEVRADGAYLERECPEHGRSSARVAADPELYRELARFYLALNGRPTLARPSEVRTHNLFVTMRCNAACPICFTGAPRADRREPTLEEAAAMLAPLRGAQVNLFGGEPTVRPDLPELVRLVRRSGNSPVLFTNGLALADLGYLDSLLGAGLGDVRLQFDGFEEGIYRVLRGRPMLEAKLLALANLALRDVPTVLEATVMRGVNDHALGDVFRWATEHDFVRSVGFRSYCVLGSAREGPERSLANDEMARLLARQTAGSFGAGDVRAFQKAHYALGHLTGTRNCLYNLHLPFVREGGGRASPLTAHIPLARAEADLDHWLEARLGGDRAAAAAALAGALARLATRRSLALAGGLLPVVAQMASSSAASPGRLPRRVLVVGFGNPCDVFTFDMTNALNCPGGNITLERGSVPSVSLDRILEAQLERGSPDRVTDAIGEGGPAS